MTHTLTLRSGWKPIFQTGLHDKKTTMTTDKKELIWVPQKFAKQYQDLEKPEKQSELLQRLLKEREDHMELDMQGLSDNTLQFQAYIVTHRAALAKAVKDEIDKLQELGEKSCEVSNGIRQASEAFSEKSLQPISDELTTIERRVDALDRRIKSINLSIPGSIMELARGLSQCNDTTKQLLRDLLNQGRGM